MLVIFTREALWRADLRRVIVEMDKTAQSARRDQKVTRRRDHKPAPLWED